MTTIHNDQILVDFRNPELATLVQRLKPSIDLIDCDFDEVDDHAWDQFWREMNRFDAELTQLFKDKGFEDFDNVYIVTSEHTAIVFEAYLNHDGTSVNLNAEYAEEGFELEAYEA